MLILPDSIYEERRRLLREREAGKLTDESFYRQLLALDPDDFMGLAGLARVFRDAGDRISAEQYYWLAITANPCASSPYLALAQLMHSQPESGALAIGLSELAILKQLREVHDENHLGDLFLDMLTKTPLPAEAVEKLTALSAEERGRLLALALRDSRDTEPELVTEILRLPRLIEDLLDGSDMDAGTVDAFIAEGEKIAPLLTGVVRAWAQDFLGEDSDVELENALGLLGETGTPNEIPWLLEFVDLENDAASGASSWALGRIMDRLPEEAVQLLESLVPSLGLPQRLKIAELVIAHDRFDPENRLFRRLSEGLEVMERAERDRYLPLFLVSMAANPRRGGVGAARAILRARGALLPRDARSEIEKLLSLFDGVDGPSLPVPPPAPTIYEICAGEAVWDSAEDEDDEDHEDDEDDEDFLAPPEPIRRVPAPGRNDPCWCNSGKKYKKCHLESDEQENRRPFSEGRPVQAGPDEFADLRRRIGEFLGKALRQGEMKAAVAEFFADSFLGDSEEIEAADAKMAVTEWMIHDWISPRLGRTVLEQFLIERGARLTVREREIAAAWTRSFVSLYEIQGLKPGAGAELKEVFSGETFFVHDVNLSRRAARWDALLVRLVPGERGIELATMAQMVPRAHLTMLREWMEDDRDEQGLAWPEYLKANWPRIRRKTFEIGDDWLDELRLTNNSGEELLFSKAVYEVPDEAKVIEALRRSAELTEDSHEDEPRKNFVWLNDQQTVLGRIRIADGELIFECNSRQRHERGERLIADLAGADVHHLRDEFTTQKEMKRRAKESPRESEDAGAEVPVEMRNEILAKFGEEHYVKWLDTSVPALGGKTPRQAARTAKGRRQLEEVLKSFENMEDWKRQRGEPFIETARVRADLGLD